MKLKFRAEKKDVVAFLWACLLLLIVVATIVVNFYHVSSLDVLDSEKHRWTFNFVKGFFAPYLKYTILFWILSIIALFASVSSYFFDREKGFGFKEGKEEKGFGRFAKEDEYKKAENVKPVEMTAKESAYAGFPLVYDKKKGLVYVDDGESHSLVIGATGSGKTQTVINPLVNFLSKKGESMVITDPKAEIFEKNSEMLKDLGYDVIVVNFRDPKNGSCWNPYTLPYKYYKDGNQDKANELLNDMAINIAVDEKSDDPFWTNSAADYLTGLSLAMFEDAKEDEISISTINYMMTLGDEKMGPSTYMKEYFKFKDPAGAAAINALGTINAPQDTKNSVVSVLKQKIKVFAVTHNLAEMLSRSDFDMETIGERKTAVFLIIQDEKTTYHALATIFVKQCYESLIAVAQRHGGKLPIRTNFLLDEFANMPKFKDITTMITAARSRQIRMTMIIQNFAQLKQVYGNEDAETIRGNCGNILYLLTGELSALEEISKLCGDKIVKVGKDKKEETRPLITVTELQRFKQDEVLILKHRLPPLRTKFLPFWNTDFGYGKNNANVPKAVLPTHEFGEIKLFDIREYIKKKKEEQRNNLFGGETNTSPQNNMFNSNPFGENSNPFGGLNTNPFASSPQANIASPMNLNIPQNDDEDDDAVDIDEMIKKIDERIAELEKEEANDNEEQDKLSDFELNIKENSDDKNNIFGMNLENSNKVISNEKIDFNSFENKETDNKISDLMDDFIEDLSMEDDSDDDDSSKILDTPTDNNIIQKEINKPEIYKNNDEINKIMNKKENDDDFDDFFE